MDAIDLLETDHRDVEKLFAAFEKAESPTDKEGIFTQIADALAVHATIEERHFYPTIKQADEDMIQESLQEHLQVKRLIADLLDMDAADEQYAAKVKVLKEEVEHHVEEEEEELFPKVRKLFDADLLDAIAQQMIATRVELEDEGAPRASVPAETDHVPPV
jgi:hemerythrin superfamily protein